MNTHICISDADLARLWDGDVTGQERQDLEQHLQSCPRCRARWEQMVAGARRLETLFGSRQMRKQDCPSEELIAAYLADALSAVERQAIEGHLARCPSCSQMVAWAREVLIGYEREGPVWHDRFAARQVLRLVARVPEELDNLLQAVEGERPSTGAPTQIIKLPMVAQSAQTVQRLAAATGEGFAEQILRQDAPAFEFHLVQFGQQLRITARPIGEDSPYEDCLARLKILEGEACRLSQIILIEQGEGQCLLEPEQVRLLQPESKGLTIRLEPFVTLEQLAAAGSEAYVPILERLLKHDAPQIRRAAAEVLARICGPRACALIERMVDDEDGQVRATVRGILKRFRHH